MTGVNQTIKVAAAVLVDDGGRTLVVRKRGTHFFMQPGGKIDAGETPEQALVRELREELDLEIDVRHLEPFGSYTALAANEDDTLVEASMFRLSHDGPFRPNAEIEEVLWYPDEFEAGHQLAPLTRDHVIPASGVRR